MIGSSNHHSLRACSVPDTVLGIKVKSCSYVLDSLGCHELYSSWNSPGQNTGAGSLSLLQMIFPTQGSNPSLPHYRQIFYQLSHKGSLLHMRGSHEEKSASLQASNTPWSKDSLRGYTVQNRFTINTRAITSNVVWSVVITAGYQAYLNWVLLLSHVRLFTTPLTTAHQASLSITNSWSLLKLMSIKLVMLSSHLILCHPLLLLPPTPPSISVFSNESTLHIRWPKYWSLSFNISPSNEHPGLISFRMDWLDLLAVQRTLKSLLNTTVQKHQFFGAQLSF